MSKTVLKPLRIYWKQLLSVRLHACLELGINFSMSFTFKRNPSILTGHLKDYDKLPSFFIYQHLKVMISFWNVPISLALLVWTSFVPALIFWLLSASSIAPKALPAGMTAVGCSNLCVHMPMCMHIHVLGMNREGNLWQVELNEKRGLLQFIKSAWILQINYGDLYL